MEDEPEPDLDEDSNPEEKEDLFEDEYEEMETGRWTPEEEYESIEGVIVEREENEEEADTFRLRTEQGAVRPVQYKTLEDDLRAAMQSYDTPQVKIIYTGEQQGTNFKYKTFRTGVKEAEAQ